MPIQQTTAADEPDPFAEFDDSDGFGDADDATEGQRATQKRIHSGTFSPYRTFRIGVLRGLTRLLLTLTPSVRF